MSQFFVLPTCAAIDLAFSYYYSINLKSLLLNLRDRLNSVAASSLTGRLIMGPVSRRQKQLYPAHINSFFGQRVHFTRICYA